jgi:uncharacterized membrane protein
MTIFQLNKRRGHKFQLSLLLFGFCMARTMTCILRISSIALPTDVPLAIAAQIFTAAGVVLIFVVNLLFTQRLVRAAHPRWGWNSIVGGIFKALYALILVTIIMVIVVVVQQFYTLDQDIHRIDRAIQIYGVTCFAIISFLPIPIIVATTAIPRKDKRPLDKFGSGGWRYKTSMLIIGTLLVSFGACYRAGVTWLKPVPQTEPLPGVVGKAPFYIVNFTVEVLTVYLYGLSRVDKRFHVPDGSKQLRSYGQTTSAQAAEAATAGSSASLSSIADAPPSTGKSEELSKEDAWSPLRGQDVDVEKAGNGARV